MNDCLNWFIVAEFACWVILNSSLANLQQLCTISSWALCKEKKQKLPRVNGSMERGSCPACSPWGPTQGLGTFDLYLEGKGHSVPGDKHQPPYPRHGDPEAGGCRMRRRMGSRKWGWYPTSVCTRVRRTHKGCSTVHRCPTHKVPVRHREISEDKWMASNSRTEDSLTGGRPKRTASRQRLGNLCSPKHQRQSPKPVLASWFSDPAPCSKLSAYLHSPAEPHDARKKAWVVITQGSPWQKTKK